MQSDFYDAFQQRSRGKEIPSLFTVKDEKIHDTIIKPIGHFYSMTSVVEFEAAVDKVVNKMIERLGECFDGKETKGRICNLGAWMHYCEFFLSNARNFLLNVQCHLT